MAPLFQFPSINWRADETRRAVFQAHNNTSAEEIGCVYQASGLFASTPTGKAVVVPVWMRQSVHFRFRDAIFFARLAAAAAQ